MTKALPEKFYVLIFKKDGSDPTYDEYFVHSSDKGMVIGYESPEEPNAPSQASLILYWCQFSPKFVLTSFEELDKQVCKPIHLFSLRGESGFFYGIKLEYFHTLFDCIRASGLDPRFDIELSNKRDPYEQYNKYAISLAEE